MAALIARHPLIFCTALFGAAMLAWRYVASLAIDSFGAWIAIPIFAGLLGIGLLWDRADRQRADRARASNG